MGISIAGLVATAEILMIRAFATADATAIAPILYTVIIPGTGLQLMTIELRATWDPE